ncbi:MAG: precorrin-2 C(20)-methyltransferase [Actinomycetia bacterium]|nr:precorrin-2 C(20)-methyltransferase [Actinomycetes bacterium]
MSNGQSLGTLYGIGTGPGDPELLTLKAVATIQKCGVIAIPDTGNGEQTAFSIVQRYAAGKELLQCHFTMEMDLERRRAAREVAAAEIIQVLKEGKDVGFVTLGDPTTYSTYMYVHQIIASQGFPAQIVPGITSFAAAAAELGISLCDGSEALTVIPASHNDRLDELLDNPGNKVIMKSGKALNRVLEKLKHHGYNQRTCIASRVTMDGQRLYRSIEEYEESPDPGYFTVAIVKEKI